METEKPIWLFIFFSPTSAKFSGNIQPIGAHLCTLIITGSIRHKMISTTTMRGSVISVPLFPVTVTMYMVARHLHPNIPTQFIITPSLMKR